MIVIGSSIADGAMAFLRAEYRVLSVFVVSVAIVLGVTYAHYTLMPKSTYMLDHINNGEQASAWLGIYKVLK